MTDWRLGPFTRPERVLEDRGEVRFTCPVSKAEVAWAAKDVFNPGAVVHEGRVCLLVRAEDDVGRYAGVSRIGLATSADGRNFELEPEPVLAPGDDPWQAWEWPGGCEDPRVVEAPDGGFVCTYTAFDGKVGTLFVATSPDLRHWTKHGPAFAGTAYVRRLTKSGAILTELKDGRLVAARLDGRFWMYWGEGMTYAATSDDLIAWTPVEAEVAPERYLTFDPHPQPGQGPWRIDRPPGLKGLRPLAGPRRHRFDSLLTEPGPPAVLTKAGIVLIYNGANHYRDGDPAAPAMAYQPGQMLFDPADPTAVIARDTEPFLRIDPAESGGQVGNVCFAEGLVAFQGAWWLYVGLADSRLGVSTAPMRP
ncbi:glycoside hydrolase family 130 protein [Phenylobacterium aquaticum]|uniref:glycoside hydrolase family 130 protein n=1 Tax=Phenylobacterium aquaticum TaxID=1763816 RepID=UPI0026E979E3|nr:glycoside hydrolase family 130 protein [Phenylobacterium aquaticum]